MTSSFQNELESKSGKLIAYFNSGIGLVTVLFNNGNGSFREPVWLYAGDSPDNLTVGDFDGDGNKDSLDYAVASRRMNSLSLFLNQGNYNFAEGGTFYVPQNPVDVEAGALDGDSLPDVVVVKQGAGRLRFS